MGNVRTSFPLCCKRDYAIAFYGRHPLFFRVMNCQLPFDVSIQPSLTGARNDATKGRVISIKEKKKLSVNNSTI